jgi:ABC-type multidrug transport system fused ATPase/permease subunit
MFFKSHSNPNRVPLRQLLKPLREPFREQWHLAALTILAGWGKFMLPMGVPLLTGYLIDDVLLEPSGSEARTILPWLGLLSLIGVTLLGTATYFRSTLAQKLASHMQHKLRRRLFHHIQRLGMNFFHRHHAGSLGSRVSSDITYAGVVVDKGLIQLSMDGVSMLTLLVVMSMNHLGLTFLTFGMLACNGLVVRHFSPVIRSGRKEIQEQQSSVTGRAAEYFSAISVVKAYAGEKDSGRDFSEHSRAVRDLQVTNGRILGFFQSVSSALLSATQLTIALVGAWIILTYPVAAKAPWPSSCCDFSIQNRVKFCWMTRRFRISVCPISAATSPPCCRTRSCFRPRSGTTSDSPSTTLLRK